MDKGTKIVVWVVLSIVVIGLIYATTKRMRGSHTSRNNLKIGVGGFLYL